jgi:hypothetical protein
MKIEVKGVILPEKLKYDPIAYIFRLLRTRAYAIIADDNGDGKFVVFDIDYATEYLRDRHEPDFRYFNEKTTLVDWMIRVLDEDPEHKLHASQFADKISRDEYHGLTNAVVVRARAEHPNYTKYFEVESGNIIKLKEGLTFAKYKAEKERLNLQRDIRFMLRIILREGPLSIDEALQRLIKRNIRQENEIKINKDQFIELLNDMDGIEYDKAKQIISRIERTEEEK